jgi:hypothetical protein
MGDAVDHRLVVLVLLALEPRCDAGVDLGSALLGHHAVGDLTYELGVELPGVARHRQ